MADSLAPWGTSVDDTIPFAGEIAVLCLVVLGSLMSTRISQRIGVPAPALFLVAAALLAAIFPRLGQVSITLVQRTATVALVLILFQGGMDIGRREFKRQAAAITWVGVAGTAVTAAGLAAVGHWLVGLDWRAALLLGAALSPTDPAVVFSVLGRRDVEGRTSVLLRGESGANDPVGIALMAALLGASSVTGWSAVGHVAKEFSEQMLVGATVGLVLGTALLWTMTHLRLPDAGLYPVRSLAGVGLIFGSASVLHGSGFLAVFIAGILIGDTAVAHKNDVLRVHSALASLGEIVVFSVLGLTVSLSVLRHESVILPGLVIAGLLILLIRPLLVGVVLIPVSLMRNERAFVLWAGLKGAVPVLLGTYLLSAGIPSANRLYGIVLVVVIVSVVVQGSLIQSSARWLGLPLTAE